MDRLREQLMEARKSRDSLRMRTLQTLIARIDNAEAVPNEDDDSAQGSEFFAGARQGLGSSEVPRKVLTMEDIAQAVRDELTEIDHALAEFVDCPEDVYAIELGKKKVILEEIKIS